MPSKDLDQAIAIRVAYGKAKDEGKDTAKLKHWMGKDRKKFGKKAIGAMISKKLKEA